MNIQGIFIDSREPAWIQKLDFGKVPTACTALEYGDLWATVEDGELVIIERKTPSDLLGSIKDKRIFHQAAGMREKTPWAYVVITGILQADYSGKVIAENRSTGWNFNAVQGALLEIQELGVGVVHCLSDSDYQKTVLRLCKRNRDEVKILEPTKAPVSMNDGERLLTALPGIGLERAKMLLHEFGNDAACALSWLTWDTDNKESMWNQDIAGIGNGIRRGVRKALGLHKGYELTVYCAADDPSLLTSEPNEESSTDDVNEDLVSVLKRAA